MTKIDHDESNLEQRLRKHYQQRYEPPPASTTVWTRIQPDLDEPGARVPRLAQRARWLPTLTGFPIARWQDVFTGREKGDKLTQSPTEVDQLEVQSPPFPQNKPSLRRRLSHTLEAAIAVMVVVGLLLGWFAVTKWRSAQGNGLALFTYTSQPGEGGYDLRWTPDGKHLVFAMGSSTNHYRYLVWDAETGKVRQTLAFDLPFFVSGTTFDVSPDAHYLLIPTKQAGTLKLANIMTGQVKQIYQGVYQGLSGPDVPSSASFSNNSKYIAFVGADWRIHIWDIAAGKTILISEPTGLKSNSWLTWSVDDKRVLIENEPLSQNYPLSLQVWDAQTGHRLANIVETPTMSLFLIGPADPGTTLGDLSPDGTRILTYNVRAGTFEEREASTLKVIQTFHFQVMGNGTVDNNGIFIPYWQANGTRIFQMKDRTAYIWNAITGQLTSTILVKGDIKQQPFGRYFALKQKGNLVEIRDMVTGGTIRTIAPVVNEALLFWLPDSEYLTVSDRNSSRQIYDALTGKLIVSYQGDLALLSPDHRYVAIDNTLSNPETHASLKDIVQVLSVP